MEKKINTEFLTAFIELETACNALLGCKRSGVTEYINELNAAGNIPGKSDVLPKLLKYRKIRNKLAHEEGALSEDNSLEKADLKWLRGFKKSVEKHRDPISKSKKGGISGKAIAWIIAAALVVVAAVLTVIFIL